MDLPKPLALESLSTQFESADSKRGKENAVSREEKKKKQNNSNNNEVEDFSPFDFGKTNY